MRIRAAEPEELSRIASLYSAWGYSAGVEPGDVVLLVEKEDEVVGLVRRTQENGVHLLRGMQVAPAERGKGIGTSLLSEFVRRLAGWECYCVPYVHLVKFYGRAGFELQPVEDAPDFLAERFTRYRQRGLDVTLMRRPPHQLAE